MKGWKTLCADVSWEDYGGTWARKARDGSWYVLRWTNMWDAMGEEECKSSDIPQYECEVKRIHFAELPEKEIAAALRCCGYAWSDDGSSVVNEHDGDVIGTGETRWLVVLEACVSYGLGAPLDSFTGNVRPRNVRANARRHAEFLMRDADSLEVLLNRPVNALGSTAREYGVGDIDAALHRGDSESHRIMRKIHGIPEEHRVQFGTLQDDGSLTNQRSIRQSDIGRCPHVILATEHYRDDGTCKCDDPEHRAKMIKEWEYTEESFAGIPLRA